MHVLDIGNVVILTDLVGHSIQMQVATQTQILDLTVGHYDGGQSFGDYLNAAKERTHGHEHVDYNRVFWFAGDLEDVEFKAVAVYAAKHGYNKIILEHLSESGIVED